MKQLLLTNPYYQELVEGFTQYLRVRGYSRSICYTLPNHVREFLYFLEERQIEALSLVKAEEVEAFLDHLEKRGNTRQGGPLSAAYLNKHLQGLKRFWAYVLEIEGLEMAYVPLKAYKKPEIPRLILSPAEIEALYEACEGNALGQRDRSMLSVYYGCGLRREEGERLNLADVEPERRRLYVAPGKNGQARYVPLTDRLSRELQNYRDQGRSWLLTRGQSEAFFLAAPGRRVGSQSLLLRFKRLLLRAGIGKEAGLHTLRHSIATHLWQAGMGLEQVSRFLGHRSLESTQVYTHLSEEEHPWN